MKTKKRSSVEIIVEILAKHDIKWPGGAKNARIVRTRAGHWQRSAGAWSWELMPIKGASYFSPIGSHETVSSLLKNPDAVVVTYSEHTHSYTLDIS